MTEKSLQADIAKWLRSQGVYVIITRVLPGVPVGCPDIIGLYGPKHVEIEVKKSATASFRPGQQTTLQLLRKDNKFVYVVYPDNWEIVKAELAAQFL